MIHNRQPHCACGNFFALVDREDALDHDTTIFLVAVIKDEGLSQFPSVVQHIDMESNGKSVALDGTPLLHSSGEVNFGGCAATFQHSFFQLLHQGRVVPVDFIGLMESQQPVEIPGEAVSNHDELMHTSLPSPMPWRMAKL